MMLFCVNSSKKNWIFSVENNVSTQSAQSWVNLNNCTPAMLGNLCTVSANTVIPGSTEFINTGSQYTEIGIAVKHGNSVIVIHLNARNPNLPIDSTVKNTFDQIISSFKFSGNTVASKYVCPTTSYVDCMPTINGGIKAECTQEALTWFKANCPGFQGAAL